MDQQQFNRKRFKLIPVWILAAVLVMGAVVRFLWNAILPDAIDANPLSYWQAVGLLVLCKILFGGFGGRPGGPRWGGGWQNGAGPKFGPPWKNRWMRMTDEERSKFKEEMRRRCGRPPRDNS